MIRIPWPPQPFSFQLNKKKVMYFSAHVPVKSRTDFPVVPAKRARVTFENLGKSSSPQKAGMLMRILALKDVVFPPPIHTQAFSDVFMSL